MGLDDGDSSGEEKPDSGYILKANWLWIDLNVVNTRDDDVEESKRILGVRACRREPALPEIGQWWEIQKMAQSLWFPSSWALPNVISRHNHSPGCFFSQPWEFALLITVLRLLLMSTLHTPPGKPCLHFHPTLFKDRLPSESLCL